MDVKERLHAAIMAAAEQAVQDGVLNVGEWPTVVLEIPPQKEFGDYATNFAMQAARAAKANPRMIAQAIVERMQASWLEK